MSVATQQRSTVLLTVTLGFDWSMKAHSNNQRRYLEAVPLAAAICFDWSIELLATVFSKLRQYFSKLWWFV